MLSSVFQHNYIHYDLIWWHLYIFWYTFLYFVLCVLHAVFLHFWSADELMRYKKKKLWEKICSTILSVVLFNYRLFSCSCWCCCSLLLSLLSCGVDRPSYFSNLPSHTLTPCSLRSTASSQQKISGLKTHTHTHTHTYTHTTTHTHNKKTSYFGVESFLPLSVFL